MIDASDERREKLAKRMTEVMTKEGFRNFILAADTGEGEGHVYVGADLSTAVALLILLVKQYPDVLMGAFQTILSMAITNASDFEEAVTRAVKAGGQL